MFPFIFLISTQVFFINLLNDKQIEIFKYSGLKNSKIVNIIAIFSFFLGIIVVVFFYNLFDKVLPIKSLIPYIPAYYLH